MSPMKQREFSLQDQMKLRRVFYLVYVIAQFIGLQMNR